MTDYEKIIKTFVETGVRHIIIDSRAKLQDILRIEDIEKRTGGHIDSALQLDACYGYGFEGFLFFDNGRFLQYAFYE